MATMARSSRLEWLCGVGGGGKWEPGRCFWCGQTIVLVDPTDYRRRQRNVHRGDEHEVEGSPNCRRLYNRSAVWNARALVILRGDPCCAECGQIDCYWEADHIVPLVDGGAHCPTNIQRLCEPCHRLKTKREAIARAERRRGPQPRLLTSAARAAAERLEARLQG